MNNFLRDLKIGQAGESLVQNVLKIGSIKSETNDDSTKNKDYDIEAWLGKKRFTLEVKYDMYSARSGNIAIEFYNTKLYRASGIDSTFADLWVHVLMEPDGMWITSVANLKDFIENNKPKRVITSGGDNNASLYLYDKDIIFDIFHRIDKLNKTDLRRTIRELL